MKHRAINAPFYKALGVLGMAMLAVSVAGIILLGWPCYGMAAGLAMMGRSIHQLEKVEKRNRAQNAALYRLADMYGL